MAGDRGREPTADAAAFSSGPAASRSGGRSAVAWIVALVTVVALAVAGRGAADPAALEPPRLFAADVSPAPTRWQPEAVRPRLVLTQPRRDRATIGTATLEVEGYLDYLDGRTGRVWVGLYARRDRLLASRELEASRLPRAASRLPHGYFDTELPLPGPRPNGTMSVLVIAYDDAGTPIAALRRVVEIGALTGEPIGRPRAGRGHGEDGLMGGLPFGTAMLGRDEAPAAGLPPVLGGYGIAPTRRGPGLR